MCLKFTDKQWMQFLEEYVEDSKEHTLALPYTLQTLFDDMEKYFDFCWSEYNVPAWTKKEVTKKEWKDGVEKIIQRRSRS